MMTPQQQQPHHHHTPPDMSPDVDDTLPRDFLVLWCIKYGLSERTESALRFHGYDKSSELLTLTKDDVMDLNLGSYEARILRGALMQYRTIDYEHDKREKKRRGQSRERFVNAINTENSTEALIRESHFLPNIKERPAAQGMVEDEFRIRMEIRRRLRKQKQAEVGATLSLADRIKGQRRDLASSRSSQSYGGSRMSLGTPRDSTPDRALPRTLEPLQEPTPPPPPTEEDPVIPEPTPRDLIPAPLPDTAREQEASDDEEQRVSSRPDPEPDNASKPKKKKKKKKKEKEKEKEKEREKQREKDKKHKKKEEKQKKKEEEKIDTMDADLDEMLNNVLTTGSRTNTPENTNKLDAKETRAQVDKMEDDLFDDDEKKIVAAMKSSKKKKK